MLSRSVWYCHWLLVQSFLARRARAFVQFVRSRETLCWRCDVGWTANGAAWLFWPKPQNDFVSRRSFDIGIATCIHSLDVRASGRAWLQAQALSLRLDSTFDKWTERERARRRKKIPAGERKFEFSKIEAKTCCHGCVYDFLYLFSNATVYVI